jgi:HSP20 family protein
MIDFFNEFKRDMWNLSRRSLEPLTSVWETEDKVIVEIDLPLVKKDNIQLRIIEEGLEVEASLARTVRYHRWGTVQRNCEFMFLHKIIPLPSPVVSERSEANFKRGILRVELRKRKEREYRITIE